MSREVRAHNVKHTARARDSKAWHDGDAKNSAKLACCSRRKTRLQDCDTGAYASSAVMSSSSAVAVLVSMTTDSAALARAHDEKLYFFCSLNRFYNETA